MTDREDDLVELELGTLTELTERVRKSFPQGFRQLQAVGGKLSPFLSFWLLISDRSLEPMKALQVPQNQAKKPYQKGFLTRPSESG